MWGGQSCLMPHTFCDAKKAGSKSSSIALQPTLFVAGFSPVLRPSRSELGPVGWRRRWGVGACMFELQKVCGIGQFCPQPALAGFRLSCPPAFFPDAPPSTDLDPSLQAGAAFRGRAGFILRTDCQSVQPGSARPSVALSKHQSLPAPVFARQTRLVPTSPPIPIPPSPPEWPRPRSPAPFLLCQSPPPPASSPSARCSPARPAASSRHSPCKTPVHKSGA